MLPELLAWSPAQPVDVPEPSATSSSGARPQDPSTTTVSEMRATLTSNIGASLYGMDQPELALRFFEKGLEEVRWSLAGLWWGRGMGGGRGGAQSFHSSNHSDLSHPLKAPTLRD